MLSAKVHHVLVCVHHLEYVWYVHRLLVCPVGTALANNPFAPFIPCHRVITSNRTIGGFCGEKHQPGSKGRSAVSHCDWKLRMLRLEGVKFDKQGHLIGHGLAMWKP